MSPLLLAHQIFQADAARLATATRNADHVARRAKQPEDIAAGL